MPDEQDMLRYTPPARLRLAGIIAVAVIALVVVIGLVTRVTASHEVSEWTDENALPAVSVISLDADKKAGDLTLPGNVQAFNSAPIYARVSGYLKKWYVDIGTTVKTGQLLAEIDVPDQDQQLAQARADLGTAVANQKLSVQTAKPVATAASTALPPRRRMSMRRMPTSLRKPLRSRLRRRMSTGCAIWKTSSESPRLSTAR